MRTMLVVGPLFSTILLTGTAGAETPRAGQIELRLNMPEVSLFASGNRQTLGLVAGDVDTTFDMGLGGGAGYFVTDRIEIGGELGIGVLAADDSSSFTFYIGPFGRYVVPLTDDIDFWGEAKLGFLHKRDSVSVGRSTFTTNTPEFRVGASAGVDYVITSSVAVYAGLGIDLYMGDTFLVPIGLFYGARIYL